MEELMFSFNVNKIVFPDKNWLRLFNLCRENTL